MTLRFLTVTESETPGFPFMPGQVITVSAITDRVHRWLDSGHAVVVREEPELATLAVGERAVATVGGSSRRRKRARQ